MVKIHVKRGTECMFFVEVTTDVVIHDLIENIVAIYNGKLKIERICSEIECLVKYGASLPPQLQGLTDEQTKELNFSDTWSEKCIPSGGFVSCVDPVGRRNGKAPLEKMGDVLTKTVHEAKSVISKESVMTEKIFTQAIVMDIIDMLQGATTIVYPMGLPPYDPITREFENCEDLSGTQAQLDVIPASMAELWWASKELQPSKLLRDYVGKNEKSKLVAKLQMKGGGPPSREPAISEEDRKQLMLQAYRRQEELKRLDENQDDFYLNSQWADNQLLKKAFHGVQNVRWKPQ